MIPDELFETLNAVNERLAGATVLRLDIKFMHHLRLEVAIHESDAQGRALRHVELTFSNLESVSARLASVREGCRFVGLRRLPSSALLDARPARNPADGTRPIVRPTRHFVLCTDQGDCHFLARDVTCRDLHEQAFG